MPKTQKPKFYVVWSGVEPGVYESWTDCQLQVKGYKGALYKSYASRREAEEAYEAGPPLREKAQALPGKSAAASGKKRQRSAEKAQAPAPVAPHIAAEALAVDAACSGNPGQMEYRGVYLGDGKEKFHYGPVWGTNNIGEFLAIVHALSLLERLGLAMPVYSDSRTALSWVRQKKCRTTLPRTPRTEQLFCLIERAEEWLRTHDCKTRVLKWDTEAWGEIPADFGRKR